MVDAEKEDKNRRWRSALTWRTACTRLLIFLMAGMIT